MPRRRRVLLPLLGVLLGLTACGSPAFEPTGQDATELRRRAEAAEGKVMERVVGPAPVLARATFDACSQGQNNWKVHDTHHYECELAHSSVIPAARTEDDVAAALRSMDTRLLADGCRPSYPRSGLDRVAAEYWPTRRFRQDGSPGMLPAGSYTCPTRGAAAKDPDESSPREVEVEVAPYAAGRDEEFDLRPDVLLTTYHAEPVLTAEPFPAGTREQVAGSGTAMHYVVTAQAMYYAVPF